MRARTSLALLLAVATTTVEAKRFIASGEHSMTQPGVIEIVYQPGKPMFVKLAPNTHTLIELPKDVTIIQKVAEQKRFKVKAVDNLATITPQKYGIKGNVTLLTNHGPFQFRVWQDSRGAGSWIKVIDPDAEKRALARAKDPLVELIKEAKAAVAGAPPELGIEPTRPGIDFEPVSAFTYADRTFITLEDDARTPSVGIVDSDGRLGMARYDVRRNVIVVEGTHDVIELGIANDIVCVGRIPREDAESRVTLNEVEVDG